MESEAAPAPVLGPRPIPALASLRSIMSRRYDLSLKGPAPATNAAARDHRRFVSMGKRARISSATLRGPYMPPETWYEPSETKARSEYKVISRRAGRGYKHFVNEEDVRSRLAQLPAWMLSELHVVQLSTMTRKKRVSPCYGMQWGNAIYLYPIEESLVETFVQPPKPAQRIEAMMYGATWEQDGEHWKLHWTETTIRDFYLNNVLIHELGHILDNRNRSYKDRERFAEWFAVEYGYKPSRRTQLAEQAVAKYVVRRHHRT